MNFLKKNNFQGKKFWRNSSLDFNFVFVCVIVFVSVI